MKLTMVGHRQRFLEVWLRQDDVAAALAPDLEAARWKAETACRPDIRGSRASDGDFDLQIHLSGLDSQGQSLLGAILEALTDFQRDDLGRLRR